MSGADIGQRLVPALLVNDMHETLAFYRRLGFALSGSHPDEATATWAEVTRDRISLQFHSEATAGTPGEPAMSGTLYVYPDDVMRLADEWRGTVDFAWGPEKMPYGQLEFGIRDPNGYFLAFAERG